MVVIPAVTCREWCRGVHPVNAGKVECEVAKAARERRGGRDGTGPDGGGSTVVVEAVRNWPLLSRWCICLARTGPSVFSVVVQQKKQQLQRCKQNDAGREGLQRLAERRGRPGLQWNRAMRVSKARQQQGRERQRSRRAGTGTGHTDGQGRAAGMRQRGL
ncbi:unnamed protein product [Calypogeia fissa]